VRVSNAKSHFALPFSTTAVFAVSVISSPNGSAVCTAGGAGGVCAAGGAGVADGAGVGGAVGAGVSGTGVAGVLAGGVAGGDCARQAAEIPVMAIRAMRKR